MKCNHCKKIIPEKEEIRIKDEFLHEECLKTLEKEKQEELLQKEASSKKDATIIGLTLAAFMFFSALYFLSLFSKRQKECDYCEELCKNTCGGKKSDQQIAKYLFGFSLVILLATGIYQITNSG